MGLVGITASIPISAPQDGPASPGGSEDRGDPAPELRASFLPRTLSLRNSISKSESGARWSIGQEAGRGRPAWAFLAEPTFLCPVMSEAGSETLEDEWQSISEIASTCNTILESLSREGEAIESALGGATMGLLFPSPTCSNGPSFPTGQSIPDSGDAKGTPKSDAE